MLSRDDILAHEDLPRERVEVPEWGGEVWVRGLSVREMDQYEVITVGLAGVLRNGEIPLANSGVRGALLAMTICDENGQRLFGLSDGPALAGKSSKATERLVDVALRLSGREVGARVRAEGNSVTPSGDSATDSPSPSA